MPLDAISTQTRRWVYTGNGVTTEFDYNNYVVADTDLEVYLELIASPYTQTLQTLTTHYTVSGAGTIAGGKVTFLAAPSSAYKVVIVSKVPNTQPSTFAPRRALSADALTAAYHRLAAQVQQLQAKVDRSVRLADGDSESLAALPALRGLYGMLLGLDADGDLVGIASPDAPVDLTGLALKFPRVNAGETAYELITAAVLTAALAAATESAQGAVELATNAETITGADTARATHPAGVKAAIDAAITALRAGVSASFDTLAEIVAGMQPLDADLTAIAALTRTRGDIIRGGASAWERYAKQTGGYVLGWDANDAVGLLPPWSQENPIINGSFRFFQRQAPGTPTSRSDDTYGPDRWNILTQSNPINCERLSDPFNGARYAVRLTQANASAQRFGIEQIIEGVNCKHLRGQAVTLFGRARCSASTTLRYAILEWTGTEDAVTSDVVNDWTSGAFTAGNFFLGSNLTVAATGSIALTANTWADITALNATLGSSANNLIALFWTDSTQAQNVTLDIANVGVVRGSVAPPHFTAPSYAEDLANCQRYYEKTFPIDTAPAQNSGHFGWGMTCPVAGATTVIFMPQFAVEKRAGSAAVTFYNPAAANGEMRNATDSADCSGTGSVAVTSKLITAVCAANAGAAAGEWLAVNWTASIEL